MSQRVSYLVLALTFFVVAGYFAFAQWTAYDVRTNGTPIAIATEPLDPIDPLLGRYVDIRYSFESVSRNNYLGEGRADSVGVGDPVWLVFEPTGEKKSDTPVYRFRGWKDTKPSDQFAIRGEVQFVTEYDGTISTGWTIHSGLERMYIEESDTRFLTDTSYTMALLHVKGDRAAVVDLLK
ncbi:MAG: GDYXXLXY domain-containing protein [Bacilli bacterium]